MKLLSFELPGNHNIFHFGDRHDGSILSSKSGWNILVDLLNSAYDGCRNNYAVEGGDDIEAICVDDKRFEASKLTEPLPLEQLKNAIEDRRKISKFYLCKLQGNHERKLWRFGDIMADICRELDVPYGTYTAKIAIKDKRGNLMYKIYEAHGHKTINSIADDPIRRKANMELTLKRQLAEKAGDCAVMIKHHSHKLLLAKPQFKLYLTDNGSRIRQSYTKWGQNESYIHPDARWYGCAGSFLTLFGYDISGYAEVAEYDPVELGFLITKVRDKEIVSVEPYYLKL